MQGLGNLRPMRHRLKVGLIVDKRWREHMYSLNSPLVRPAIGLEAGIRMFESGLRERVAGQATENQEANAGKLQ